MAARGIATATVRRAARRRRRHHEEADDWRGTTSVLGLQATVGNQATTALLTSIQRSPDAGHPMAVQLALQRAAAGSHGIEPTVRRGSTGATVKVLQDHLVQAGAGVQVDGIFGPATGQAVVVYQRAAGLAADGIVGPMTWTSLKTGGVKIPGGSGRRFGVSDAGDKVAARLRTIATRLAPFASGGSTVTHVLPAAPAHAGVADDVAAVLGPAAAGGGTPAAAEAPTSVLDAAAQVAELLVRMEPAVRSELGQTGEALDAIVGGLVAGGSAVPLESTLVQLDTIVADVGEFAANQAGAATDTGSTTVGVTSDTTYKITGDTIADVGQELDVRQSTHGEAGHVTSLGPSLATSTVNDRVTKATIVVALARVLPEWTKAGSTKCACWKQEWNRFDGALRAHEQEHVNIYKKFWTGAHLKLIGKTEKKAEEEFDKVEAVAEKAQGEFDTRTKNGREPAPGTNFDAGKPCTC
jgi:peptidoglycan hydrolase-like protein with peptidoglycan-binding domain